MTVFGLWGQETKYFISLFSNFLVLEIVGLINTLRVNFQTLLSSLFIVVNLQALTKFDDLILSRLPGVIFIKILKSYFVSIFLRQESTNLKFYVLKSCAKPSYKKAMRKTLVKLTTVMKLNFQYYERAIYRTMPIVLAF
jgi:hypothetical protein